MCGATATDNMFSRLYPKTISPFMEVFRHTITLCYDFLVSSLGTPCFQCLFWPKVPFQRHVQNGMSVLFMVVVISSKCYKGSMTIDKLKCTASSSASLPKGDRGGSRKHHMEPGIVLGINMTDFIGSFTMSPGFGRQQLAW